MAPSRQFLPLKQSKQSLQKTCFQAFSVMPTTLPGNAENNTPMAIFGVGKFPGFYYRHPENGQSSR
jgi:hypothetical protein